MTRVLVTGATGFVGRALVPFLAGRGHEIVEAGRRPRDGASRFLDVGEIGAATDWRAALKGVDAVVHVAGIAHRDSNGADDSYFEVNERGTARLAASASAAGVRSFIFMSSAHAGRADGSPSAYALSKRLAEDHVAAAARTAAGAWISIRPPLIHAADAPANWKRLQGLAASGLPLPFSGVRSRRSLLARVNLCDAVAVALEAGGSGHGGRGTYAVSDGVDLSLPRIIALLRRGMGIPDRLFPVPDAVLRLAGRLAGRGHAVETLMAELTVDPSPFMRDFSWTPPVEAEKAVRESGAGFLAMRRAPEAVRPVS